MRNGMYLLVTTFDDVCTTLGIFALVIKSVGNEGQKKHEAHDHKQGLNHQFQSQAGQTLVFHVPIKKITILLLLKMESTK